MLSCDQIEKLQNKYNFNAARQNEKTALKTYKLMIHDPIVTKEDIKNDLLSVDKAYMKPEIRRQIITILKNELKSRK